MAVVTAVLGVANVLVLEGSARTTMAVACTVIGPLLGATWFVLRFRSLPDRWANAALAAIILLLAAGSMLHLYVASDERLSSNTMLLLVGAGAFVLDVRWFAATAAGVWAVWGVAAALVPLHVTGWTHWAFGMVGATLLGAFVGTMSRASIDRFSALLEHAERAAVQDDLTGLLNRRGLAMVGEQVVAAARRGGNAVHCSFVDVDGLKDVNDRHGHLAGDRVLVAVADAIRLSVRGGDVVARWGGDEFCILGPGPGTAPVDLERRVLSRILQLPPDDVRGWDPRVSAGSAMLAPWDDGDLASLLDQADREMYRRRSLRRDAPVAPTEALPPRSTGG